MTKKRTSLDSLELSPEAEASTPPPTDQPVVAPTKKRIIRQTVYLPADVHEQIRCLAFEERAKMHDYLMEGLDLVFEKRGLPSIAELADKP